jgi:hypothetical protein
VETKDNDKEREKKSFEQRDRGWLVLKWKFVNDLQSRVGVDLEPDRL